MFMISVVTVVSGVANSFGVLPVMVPALVNVPLLSMVPLLSIVAPRRLVRVP